MSSKLPSGWMWVGAGAILVGLLAWLVLAGRTEPVTRERLAAAERVWRAANVNSYDMDLETRGAMTGRYHIEVRDSKLTEITRNGQPQNPAEGEYWTVEGLFRTIELDLDNAEQPGGAFPEGCQFWLRMRCHSKLGYAVRYVKQIKPPTQRTESGYEAPAAALGVEIRVLRLDPR